MMTEMGPQIQVTSSGSPWSIHWNNLSGLIPEMLMASPKYWVIILTSIAGPVAPDHLTLVTNLLYAVI